MEDGEFLRLFHDGDLPSEEFRHRGHLRLAWLVLSKHSRIEAESIFTREIRRFAIAKGASNRYHDTLTRFWVHLVGHAMANAPEDRSIDELLARFPFLLEKGLPFEHWRGETLNSDQARARWVEPDLVPCPELDPSVRCPGLVASGSKRAFLAGVSSLRAGTIGVRC